MMIRVNFIQLKISDEQPCTSPYYENMNGKLYILDAMKGRNTCSRGIANKLEDDTYYKIDTYNKKNLFADNNIVSIVNTLPSFNLNDYNVDTNLYVREYVGINPSCTEKIKRSTRSKDFIAGLANMESDMGSTITYSIAILILQCIATLFSIFLVVSLLKDSKPKSYYYDTIICIRKQC
jgi:hypothetical protein